MSVEAHNEALAFDALDTLFNKSDYAAAKGFCTPRLGTYNTALTLLRNVEAHSATNPSNDAQIPTGPEREKGQILCCVLGNMDVHV